MKKKSALAALLLSVSWLTMLGAQAPPDSDFVFYQSRMTFSGEAGAPVVRDCVTVKPDHTWTYERTSQDFRGGSAEFRVYRGSLTEANMQQLQQLLASKELDAAATVSRTGWDGSVQEGEIVDAYMHRGNDLLEVDYSASFGRVPLQHQGLQSGYNNPQITKGSRALEPIEKFLHNNIQKQKGKSLKGEAAHCYPPIHSDAFAGKAMISK